MKRYLLVAAVALVTLPSCTQSLSRALDAQSAKTRIALEQVGTVHSGACDSLGQLTATTTGLTLQTAEASAEWSR